MNHGLGILPPPLVGLAPSDGGGDGFVGPAAPSSASRWSPPPHRCRERLRSAKSRRRGLRFSRRAVARFAAGDAGEARDAAQAQSRGGRRPHETIASAVGGRSPTRGGG